ncbi:uncharacterized protein C2orf81 homolog [Molothrus ater]|uniref:uncharacterized protein C2orf81 homolog n=1 Tax=Molothrus ater TaxID=84834 RepID=UPI0023E8B612|nr:uncharacterized protein C2orf81 homolog [Molothrus ater]
METRRGPGTPKGRRWPRGSCGCLCPEQKGKSRGAGTRSKQDKPRAQPRQSKRGSPRSSGRTSIQPSPSPEPLEPLDVEPILDELLERVLTEVALAAVARQRVPFAVARARDAILFVAEWRFLVRDEKVPEPEGDPEPERDGVWKEDEEPPAGIWDSWTPGVVAVAEASPPSEELPSEELSEAEEAQSPPVGPGEVPAAAPAVGFPRPRGPVPSGARLVTAKGPLGRDTAAAPAVGVPLSPGQSRSAAAAAAPPVQPPVPRPPPGPKPPSAAQPRERGRRLSRSPERRRPPSRAPGRRCQPSRPPQPRAAPPEAPPPPVPPPVAPPEPAAPAAPEPREQEAPPPSSSSRSSAGSVHPRRLSRSPGVPRLGARRGAARWVLPEVKVLDVSTEAERPRLGASRTRLPLPGSLVQVIPATARAARAEPQLCDSWLASVRLAPGVTVRWGRCERRGPALAGHGGDEQGDEALRRAEKDLKPILPSPECRLSEYGEAEEWQDIPLETERLPELPLPAPGPALGGSLSPRVSPVQWLEPAVASGDPPGDRGSFNNIK